MAISSSTGLGRTIRRRNALPEGWERMRMKGLRFRLICVGGKVLNHSKLLTRKKISKKG